MKKNLFIALEGIDGSGKTTQAKILTGKLEDKGYKVYSTCEPTDGAIGILIRKILKGEMKVDEHIIAALFVADRLDHLLNETNGIVKKLGEGYTVVTDRYYFSSYAYHGVHVDMNWVIEANAVSAKICRPDLNIFIDAQPETSMSRIQNRTTTEMYETLENLTSVRTNFLNAFSKLGHKENITVIDGNRSLELIADDVWNSVNNIFMAKDN